MKHFLTLVTLATLVGWTVGTEFSFFQVTDIHYEPTYCVGCKTKDFCRAHKSLLAPSLPGAPTSADKAGLSSSSSGDVASYWGSYECDIPYVMAESAVSQLAKLVNATSSSAESVPPFVLWTGDSGPHKLTEEDQSSSLDAVLASTRLMQSKLSPDTPVFPTLGNLDVFPNGQLPDEASLQFYSVIGDSWAPWLGLDALTQFRQTGYYAQDVPGLKMTVISLNTILWFKTNQVSRPNLSKDPLGQFDWLEAHLAAASGVGSQVIVMGHVPPQDFHLDYNAKFVKILRKYPDAIYALVFAHWHQNMVSFLWKEGVSHAEDPTKPISESPLLVQYSASSVTSRKHRNPTLRKYSADTTTILDYTTYRCDLEQTIATNVSTWLPFYSATTAYGLKDLTTHSWYTFYLQLYNEAPTLQSKTSSSPPSSSSSALWDLFVGQHLISNTYSCDKDCAKEIVAKMECVDMSTTKDCDDIPTTS